MVTKTFGSPGADHIDLGTAINACVALGALGDDYTYLCIADHINTTGNAGTQLQPNSHTITFDLGGKTVRSRQSILLNTAGPGWVGNPIYYGTVRLTNGSIFQVEPFTYSYNSLIYLQSGFTAWDANRDCNQIIMLDKVFVSDHLCTINNSLDFLVYSGLGSLGKGVIYNVKLFNKWVPYSLRFIDVPAGLLPEFETVTRVIQNCSLYHLGAASVGFSVPDLYALIQNVISCRPAPVPGIPDYVYPTIKPTINNSADSDNSIVAPMVDCLHNVVPADEFISIDPASSDFLKLKPGSVTIDFNPKKGQVPLDVTFGLDYIFTGTLYNSGAAPTLNPFVSGEQITLENKDINGDPYQAGMYPIGCHNAEINL